MLLSRNCADWPTPSLATVVALIVPARQYQTQCQRVAVQIQFPIRTLHARHQQCEYTHDIISLHDHHRRHTRLRHRTYIVAYYAIVATPNTNKMNCTLHVHSLTLKQWRASHIRTSEAAQCPNMCHIGSKAVHSVHLHTMNSACPWLQPTCRHRIHHTRATMSNSQLHMPRAAAQNCTEHQLLRAQLALDRHTLARHSTSHTRLRCSTRGNRMV